MNAIAGLFSPILAPDAIITNPESSIAYTSEQRGAYTSTPAVILLPETVTQVQKIVRKCLENTLSIVPQGGNTGLVGGSVADTKQVLVNFARLNTIHAISIVESAMRVDAGCTLAQVKQAAAAQNMLFPLGLSVADKCQIGGTIASNAGGINVLQYGMMRNLVLGLDVVLPDGRLLENNTVLMKKNEGFDLKQLFIGTEGTFGLIVAASLKIFPAIQQEYTLLLPCADAAEVADKYMRLRSIGQQYLTAFEVLTQPCFTLLRRTRPQIKQPERIAPFMVLARLSASTPKDILPLRGAFKKMADTIGATLLRSAASNDLWALRRELPWAQRDAGASLKHDIAVPIAAIPDFLEQAGRKVQAIVPGAPIIAFGHWGDGNIHYNISQPDGMEAAVFLQHKAAVNDAVLGLVRDLGGAISAEHGIGLARLHDYARLTPLLIRQMQQFLKQSFDPQGVFNPGKGAGAH
jgi:FAD/FMN-containing dehydrogenase